MSDPIEAGTHFNRAVESTSVVGTIRADLANVQKDVSEIKGDVKAIKTTIDRWGGAIAITSALVSVAVSMVVGILK